MLRQVMFRPDPLSDPRSLGASPQWWPALSLALSTVFHLSLGLALPTERAIPPAPVFAVTEVFDLEPPPPPEPPPPAPPLPAEPPPTAPPPALRSSRPTPQPSPAAPPQAAAAVLTAADDAGPLDFTDSFVTGQATAFAGGATSSRGTTSDRRARVAGGAAVRASGSGSGPSSDHSRRASVVGGFAWSCPFPPAADVAGINVAVVELKLRVNARGKLDAIGVLADPGHGFGEAARRCAAGKQFRPALDRNGAPLESELVVRVRFTR